MITFCRVWFFSIAFAVLTSQAYAAMILTVVPRSFVQGSGIQSLEVRVNSTANESILGLTADFLIQAGTLTSPAGLFGEPGFVGAGNIQSAASSFNRGATNPRLGLLSIEFTTPQSIPSTPGQVASLNIDTTGLAIGTYSVSVSSFATDAAANQSVNGSFSITAVPEPTSFLLAGLAGGGLILLRLRKKHSNKC